MFVYVSSESLAPPKQPARQTEPPDLHNHLPEHCLFHNWSGGGWVPQGVKTWQLSPPLPHFLSLLLFPVFSSCLLRISMYQFKHCSHQLAELHHMHALSSSCCHGYWQAPENKISTPDSSRSVTLLYFLFFLQYLLLLLLVPFFFHLLWSCCLLCCVSPPLRSHSMLVGPKKARYAVAVWSDGSSSSSCAQCSFCQTLSSICPWRVWEGCSPSCHCTCEETATHLSQMYTQPEGRGV